MSSDDRAPVENTPERIPSPEDQAKIREFFDMVDHLHERVRGPWGVSWVEVVAMLASLQQTCEWALGAAVDPRYRYRIDPPMDESIGFDLPDHPPEDWK